eukprot:74193_1
MEEKLQLALISGYVRYIEQSVDLFMQIPVAITELIYDFYPRIRKIDRNAFNKDQFLLQNEDTKIIGNGCCSSYLIYAQCDNGFDKGIHLWSVKALIKPNCYRYIGIIDKKKSIYINTPNARINDDEQSLNYLYPPRSEHWTLNTTLTVKLDCNKWKIIFYANDIQKQEQQIEPRRTYYFVLKVCADKKFTILECVEPTVCVS